ncbi:Hypothetical protein CINCED_3A007364 [Cinara cedri]|uniref:Uncharacterized protein n=1 Tax=Cinara cedri TaxID=506608 RepID=A0A5E4N8I0_9HEMI|nr:Hypothetical protein CINCED_3A007364 [Cinara cedri]
MFKLNKQLHWKILLWRTNLSFKVSIVMITSELFITNNGSVPLKYNLYTSDLPNTKSQRFYHVDDFAKAIQTNSPKEGEHISTTDLETQNCFCQGGSICLNPSRIELCSFYVNN